MSYSFDLDSTLADTRHRAHLINQENRELTDWDAYSMACADDGPGPALPLALEFQALGGRIVIASARSECAREPTEWWLKKAGLNVDSSMVLLHDTEIFGHGDGTVETHIRMKGEMVARLDQMSWANYGEGISLHVDDWPQVKDIVQNRTQIPTVIVHVSFEEVGYDYDK